MGNYCFIYRLSVWDDEKVLKIESVDGCTLYMYLMPLNCML